MCYPTNSSVPYVHTHGTNGHLFEINTRNKAGRQHTAPHTSKLTRSRSCDSPEPSETAHSGLDARLRRQGPQRSAPGNQVPFCSPRINTCGTLPGNTDGSIGVSAHATLRPLRRGFAENYGTGLQLEANFEDTLCSKTSRKVWKNHRRNNIDLGQAPLPSLRLRHVRCVLYSPPH
jgi:hypothetical protein